MSRIGIDAIDSRSKHEQHVARVEAKYQTLMGKKAILAAWEASGRGGAEYLRGLRKRIRSIECNLLAMRPMKDEEFS